MSSQYTRCCFIGWSSTVKLNLSTMKSGYLAKCIIVITVLFSSVIEKSVHALSPEGAADEYFCQDYETLWNVCPTFFFALDMEIALLPCRQRQPWLWQPCAIRSYRRHPFNCCSPHYILPLSMAAEGHAAARCRMGFILATEFAQQIVGGLRVIYAGSSFYHLCKVLKFCSGCLYNYCFHNALRDIILSVYQKL